MDTAHSQNGTPPPCSSAPEEKGCPSAWLENDSGCFMESFSVSKAEDAHPQGMGLQAGQRVSPAGAGCLVS